MEKLILILIGTGMIAFSFPKIRAPLMNRAYNEGYVTAKRVDPEATHIIKNTGPGITLFALGIVLIIIGIIL